MTNTAPRADEGEGGGGALNASRATARGGGFTPNPKNESRNTQTDREPTRDEHPAPRRLNDETVEKAP